MPGDKSKDKSGDKHSQTMLAHKKLNPVNQDKKASGHENPAKRDKRTHSDVAEDSIENVDIMTIHSDLKEIKTTLQDTVKRSDIDQLVTQKDLKELVTTIVQSLLGNLREEFDAKLRERTGKLQDEVDSLNFENNNLKERLRQKDKQLEELKESVEDCKNRSIDAIKLGNYNEQYSRKHNIRMVNYPERKDENLRDKFVQIVNEDLKVNIESSDVIAIHRIPGKKGDIRPVIVKVRNTEMKIDIMRNKKGLKNGVKFHDDITQRNLGLLTRLGQKQDLDNSWFYNCSVYGKLKNSKHKIKFDLFDNIDEKIQKKLSES